MLVVPVVDSCGMGSLQFNKVSEESASSEDGTEKGLS